MDAKKLKKLEAEVQRLQKREAKSKSVIADLRAGEKDAKRQLLSQSKQLKRLAEQRERYHMGLEEQEQKCGTLAHQMDDALQEIGDAWPAGMHEEAPLVLQAWITPVIVAPVAEDGAIASDWIEQYDESSGATYYYNTATGETSWEVPVGYGVELDPSALLEDGAAGYAEDGTPLALSDVNSPFGAAASPYLASGGATTPLDPFANPAASAFGFDSLAQSGMTSTQFRMVTMVGLDGQPRAMRSAPSTPRREEEAASSKVALTSLEGGAEGGGESGGATGAESKLPDPVEATIGEGLPAAPVAPAGAAPALTARKAPRVTRRQRFLNLFASATQRVRLLSTLTFSDEAIESEALELALHVTREIRTIQRSSEEEEEEALQRMAKARKARAKARRAAKRAEARAEARAERERWEEVQRERKAQRKKLVLKQRYADAETVRAANLAALREQLAVHKVHIRMHTLLEPACPRGTDEHRSAFVKARAEELEAAAAALREEAEAAVREGRRRAPPSALERMQAMKDSIANSEAYAAERARYAAVLADAGGGAGGRPSSAPRILEPNADERTWHSWESVSASYEKALVATHAALKAEKAKTIAALLGALVNDDSATAAEEGAPLSFAELAERARAEEEAAENEEEDGAGVHDDFEEGDGTGAEVALPPLEETVESADPAAFARLMLSLVAQPPALAPSSSAAAAAEEGGPSTATKAAAASAGRQIVKHAVCEVRHPVSRTLGLCRLRLYDDGAVVYRIRRQDFAFPCMRDAESPLLVRCESGKNRDRTFTLSTLTEMVQFKVGTVAEMEEWVQDCAKYGWELTAGVDPRGDGPGSPTSFGTPLGQAAVLDEEEAVLQGWQRLKSPALDLRPLHEDHPVDKIFASTLRFWVHVRDSILTQQSAANAGVVDRVTKFMAGGRGAGESKVAGDDAAAQAAARAKERASIARLDAENAATAVPEVRALAFMPAEERAATTAAAEQHSGVMHWARTAPEARPSAGLAGPVPASAIAVLEAEPPIRGGSARSSASALSRAQRSTTAAAEEHAASSNADAEGALVASADGRRVGIHADWVGSWHTMLAAHIEGPSAALQRERDRFMAMMEGCAERAERMRSRATDRRGVWSEQLAMLEADIAEEEGAAEAASRDGVIVPAMRRRADRLAKSIAIADRAMQLLAPHQGWVDDEIALERKSLEIAGEVRTDILSSASSDLALEAQRGAAILEALEMQSMEVEEKWARTLAWAGAASANFMERAQRESEAEAELEAFNAQRWAIADAVRVERARQAEILVLRERSIHDLANFIERETVQIEERETFVRSVLESVERQWEAEREQCKHELLEITLLSEEIVAEQLHTSLWSQALARRNYSEHEAQLVHLQSRVEAHNAALLAAEGQGGGAVVIVVAGDDAGGDQEGVDGERPLSALPKESAAMAEVQRRAGQGADLSSDPLVEMAEWEARAQVLRAVVARAQDVASGHTAQALALTSHVAERKSNFERWNNVDGVMGWWSPGIVDGADHSEDGDSSEDEEGEDASRPSTASSWPGSVAPGGSDVAGASPADAPADGAVDGAADVAAAPAEGAGLAIEVPALAALGETPLSSDLTPMASPLKSPLSDDEDVEVAAEEPWHLLVLTNTRPSATKFSSAFHSVLVAEGAAATARGARGLLGPRAIPAAVCKSALAKARKSVPAGDMRYCADLATAIAKWRIRMKRYAKRARHRAKQCRALAEPLTGLWTLGRTRRRVSNKYDHERGRLNRAELTSIATAGLEALLQRDERAAAATRHGFEKALKTSRYQVRPASSCFFNRLPLRLAHPPACPLFLPPAPLSSTAARWSSSTRCSARRRRRSARTAAKPKRFASRQHRRSNFSKPSDGASARSGSS